MINQNLLLAGDDGYNLTNSLRFRGSASAYLNRTPASASNRQTWTWSGWVKIGALDSSKVMFSAGSSSSVNIVQLFFSSNSLSFQIYDTSTVALLQSTAVYRDPAAWYHVVAVMNTTASTSTNRMQLYVNGVQLTSFSTATYPAQNFNAFVNTVTDHSIGNLLFGSRTNQLDGYIAEVNFIDGQALTPTSFGSFNALTGVWQPAKYTGTYGTNGFYLPFTDNSALTTSSNVGLGKDFSGNGNYWTTNNISITAGTTYDSMTDVPTLTNATTANYAVVNPLKKSASATISDGNLTVAWNSNGGEQPNTIAVSSGKWYWEQTQNAAFAASGIILSSAIPSSSSFTQGYHYYGGNGQFYTGVSNVAYGATFGNGDVIGIALDLNNNEITFYKNNVSQGVKSIVAGEYNPDFASAGTITINANFGQRPFAYTPPTGFVALNTFNLPSSTIVAGNKQMDVSLWTGNGTSQSIINSGSMQPDFVWYKGRSTTFNHGLFDSIRGTLQRLSSNLTSAESTTAGSLTAFNSNGFSVGSDAGANQNTDTYVGWQWKESVSAGFDIVTYTGNGTSQWVNHSLGVAPQMIIIKSSSTVTNWIVYQAYTNAFSYNYYLQLNTTSAAINSGSFMGANPTSTQFNVGSLGDVNNSGSTFVAYCWAPIAGYSAFGSYTGNGSADGPFVYLGFRPRFVMVKRTDSTSTWGLIDTARDTYNVTTKLLFPNTSDAENTSYTPEDILSNGFKLRDTTYNISSGTYIYAAFAENPFKNSLAR